MATSNNDVKRLGITHDFTPEMVTELLKCEMDPIYFIENYVYVVHPTKGKVLMKLYEYQKRMVRAIHQNKETILLCSRQMGKCFSKDTTYDIIKKPSGFKKLLLKFIDRKTYDDLEC